MSFHAVSIVTWPLDLAGYGASDILARRKASERPWVKHRPLDNLVAEMQQGSVCVPDLGRGRREDRPALLASAVVARGCFGAFVLF